jgi:hypothetical protein
MIWVEREEEYFCKGDRTGGIRLNRFNKPAFARNSVERIGL